MRTSRIGPTHSSIYRNTTRRILSDTYFADAVNSGLHDHLNHSHERQSRGNNKKNKPQARPKKLVANKMRLIVKGMQFNADSAVTLNQLFKFTSRANINHQYKHRIKTYNTSI